MLYEQARYVNKITRSAPKELENINKDWFVLNPTEEIKWLGGKLWKN